jgi:hypothetical protein
VATRFGTVWIVWNDARGSYSRYWDAAPTRAAAMLEQAPETRDLSAAVTWGCMRARRVIVRPESDPDVHYWAGDGRRPKQFPALPVQDSAHSL